ncbi:MAG: DNA mismatch repair protein [Pleopsidium flavum]|nr:MAG: DNA mismatch repair protein [Pleopsidium flavum]
MVVVITPILPLPADVVAQIKSSTAITSLTGVVLDLVRNSLDAESHKVEIVVDFARGACTVEDDGSGIPPAEFHEDGGLGKMYSQLSSTVLENIDTSKHEVAGPVYGRNGTFLCSLTALSLVSITSRHFSHRAYSTMSLYKSEVVARLIPAPSHQHLSAREHGTRVTVRDLFGNMPVRVKHRAVAFQGQGEKNRELDNLKKSIVALLLACGRSITVIARDSEGNSKLIIRGLASSALGSVTKSDGTGLERIRSFRLSHVRSMLSQAAYISPSGWQSWVSASARTPSITIRGAFSLEPAPSKHVQFISIGIRPVYIEGGGNELYDSVNRIFASSSFGALEEGFEADSSEKQQSTKDGRLKRNEPTNRQLRGGRKGVDRWPMFYLRIDLHSSAKSSSTAEDGVLENERSLKTIVDVLTEMTTHFLKEHYFRPRAKRTKMRAISKDIESSTHPGSISLPVMRSDSAPVLASISNVVAASQTDTGGKSTLLRHPSNSCRAVAHNENNGDRKSKSQGAFTDDHVRIPSFSKRQRHEHSHGLNGWSRVKASKGDVIDDVCAGLPTTMVRKGSMQPLLGSDTERESRQPGIGTLSTTTSNEANLQEQVQISPRNDLVESSEEPSKDVEEDERSTQSDEILLWTNPISKATVRINSRTGIVVPQDPSRPRTAPGGAQLSTTPLQSHSRRSGRSVALRCSNTDRWNSPKAGSWIGKFLETWDNPVFRQTEKAIPQIMPDALNSETGKPPHGLEHPCLRADTDKILGQPSNLPGKLSREGLKKAEVIAQVDSKFILVKMGVEIRLHTPEDGIHQDRQLLVLVDQHAADERCRIERLLAELYRAPSGDAITSSNLGHVSQILTTSLTKAITFQVPPNEYRLFKLHARHFASWGILYDMSDGPKRPLSNESEVDHRVVVKTLPPGIVERCKMEPKQLINLLRAEIWKREENGSLRRTAPAKTSPPSTTPVQTPYSDEVEDSSTTEHHWLHHIGDCPQGILDMLNSRSCRSAIMFNDQLSGEQCQTLISRLAECAFPFQCAHGRPSMVPLVDLGVQSLRHSEGPASQSGSAGSTAFGLQGMGGEGEGVGFREAFGRWKERHNHGCE